MRYFHVRDGIIENCSLWGGKAPFDPGSDVQVIPEAELPGLHIGDSVPEPEPQPGKMSTRCARAICRAKLCAGFGIRATPPGSTTRETPWNFTPRQRAPGGIGMRDRILTSCTQ